MSEPRFFSVQRAFTQYLRDPDHVTPPADLAGERLAVYSHAVIKNAETFIGENFPRVKSLFPEAAWTSMVRDYFRRHASTTPLFVELPGEFLRYLDELRDEPDDPPFLYELAHFEFLETEVSADEQRIDETGVDPAGDVITGVPLVNPTLRLVRYTYPVHRIDVSSRPDGEPGPPTFIAAAGGDPAEYDFDGMSFLPVLKGETETHREFVYGVQTSKGIIAGPDAYGIRSVRSERYKLIWNVNHENKFQNIVTDRHPVFQDWKTQAVDNNELALEYVKAYQDRPEYEFYDLSADPYELKNLAGSQEHQTEQNRLRRELERWMKQQGDTGQETEFDALNRQGRE